jgi:hypothetical protein
MHSNGFATGSFPGKLPCPSARARLTPCLSSQGLFCESRVVVFLLLAFFAIER